MAEQTNNLRDSFVLASAVDTVLWHLACDNMTVNDAREKLGLGRDPIRMYDVRLCADAFERGKDAMRRELAGAMYAVVKGDKTPNEALRAAGLAPINDPRMDKKLVPEPEPPVKPDIYICKSGGHYEMMLHSGAFRGTAVEFKGGQTAREIKDTIFRAIAAYWLEPRPALIAYDPWIATGTMQEVLTDAELGAIPMKPGDAFKAITKK